MKTLTDKLLNGGLSAAFRFFSGLLYAAEKPSIAGVCWKSKCHTNSVTWSAHQQVGNFEGTI
jgi:hypothetical protein